MPIAQPSHRNALGEFVEQDEFVGEQLVVIRIESLNVGRELDDSVSSAQGSDLRRLIRSLKQVQTLQQQGRCTTDGRHRREELGQRRTLLRQLDSLAE